MMSYYIAFLFWLFGFFLLWRIPYAKKKDNPDLNDPDVSVIIPARNEGAALARLLRSLRAQSVKPAEIIVVDDQSEDATAEVARRYGATVLLSPDLPDGWVGKTWACWQGANHASGDMLIFLDADTFLEPGGLEKIVSTYDGKGLLSIQPFHQMERPYERLSALFNIIVMASIRAFSVFGTKLKPLGAFGPCIVCRRETYFALGGHQTVRGNILEHHALGRVFIRAGHAIRCYGGRGALSFRMYPHGLGSLFSGCARSVATGAGAMPFVSLLLIICWIFGAFGVTRHLVQSAFSADGMGLLAWVGLHVLYVFQIHWMLARIGNFGLVTPLLFQVPLMFFAAAFFWSLVLTFFKKRVRWKGRLVTPGEGKTA
jgi:4,4'-diaponeurosporenoate glycosyltransferase